MGDLARAPAVIREARPQDAAVLLELFGELAAYERLEHEVQIDEHHLSQALFGPRPVAFALIAERGTQAAGYALFYPTFSSFRGSLGMWLHDLFVRPAHRGAGVGRALFSAVAARAREQGGERLEWVALDWNDLALGFYESRGARKMDDWITHRLDGEALTRVAEESAGH